MTRRYLLVVLAAALAFAALLGFVNLVDKAPRRVQLATGHSIVVIAAPGLRWADVTSSRYPDLWSTLDYGAIGSLTPRGGATGTCSSDAWLTLSAGRGVSAPDWCKSPPAPSGGSIPGWSQQRSSDAPIGLLADRYSAAGKCVAAVGPGAALAAADSTGKVRHYSPKVAGASYSQCALTLVDASEGWAHTTMAQLDAAFSAIPSSATVIVTGLSDGPGVKDAGDARLRSLFVLGNTVKHGTIWSASVRQPGVVQLPDLTATLLAPLGKLPDGVLGSPLQVAANQTPSGSLVSQARADDTALRGASDLTLPFAGGWGVIGLLLGLVLWRRRDAVPGWLPPTLTWWAALPAASFLAVLTPWSSWPAPALWLAVFSALYAGVITGVAYAGRWRRSVIGPVVAVAIATWVVLGIDVMHGARLQFGALLGFQPLNGGRFYGMGNVGFALFATSALVAAGLGAGALRERGETRLAAWTIGLAGLATVVIDGWPGWGADFGGPPGVVLATVVLVALALGVRLRPKLLVSAALAAFVVVAVLAFADWLRPPGSRTHLGRFVQQVIDGQGLGVIGEKLGANLALVFASPVNPLVPILLVALIWLMARPASTPGARLADALATVPFARETLIGLLVVWTIGFAMNDSGLTLLADGMGLAVAFAVALEAQRRRRVQDRTIHI